MGRRMASPCAHASTPAAEGCGCIMTRAHRHSTSLCPSCAQCPMGSWCPLPLCPGSAPAPRTLVPCAQQRQRGGPALCLLQCTLRTRATSVFCILHPAVPLHHVPYWCCPCSWMPCSARPTTGATRRGDTGRAGVIQGGQTSVHASFQGMLACIIPLWQAVFLA